MKHESIKTELPIPLWMIYINTLLNNPTKTIYDISRRTNTSYSRTFIQLKDLETKNIVRINKKGRSSNVNLTKKGEAIGEHTKQLIMKIKNREE